MEKLQLNISQFLEGRSLRDLNIHEVYVLAKVLPGFTKEKRHQAYKGVLREAIEEGSINYSSSLQVLRQIRQELEITDDKHREILNELGIEDPELFNPNRQRNLENSVRLNSYQKSLQRLLLLQKLQLPNNFEKQEQSNLAEIQRLRRQYGITSKEEDWILDGLDPETCSLRNCELLLSQLPELISCYQALSQPELKEYRALLIVLRESVTHKKELIYRTILSFLETSKNEPSAMSLAQSLGQLPSSILPILLETEDWNSRLDENIFSHLTSAREQVLASRLKFTSEEIVEHLERLMSNCNPLMESVCLYMIAQLDSERGKMKSRDIQSEYHHPLLQETAKIIFTHSTPILSITAFPTLEKVIYLYNSDFFSQISYETLIALAGHSQVKTYSYNAVITEEGDTCRELLLLMEGSAQIQFHLDDGNVQMEMLQPGQTLDELEVLGHSESKSKIVAFSDITRILAIPVDIFDDLLTQDHDFARRVLELESRQLQHFIHFLQYPNRNRSLSSNEPLTLASRRE